MSCNNSPVEIETVLCVFSSRPVRQCALSCSTGATTEVNLIAPDLTEGIEQLAHIVCVGDFGLTSLSTSQGLAFY